MEVSRSQYLEQRERRFGRANPERFRLAFWEMMVRSGEGAYWARQKYDDAKFVGPVWCFDRFGRSETPLEDGRVLYIAGEHEDYYDPDFCIYNDLVITSPNGSIEIFGYPPDVFPPTDFHSATRVGEQIVLVGNVGYQKDRKPGYTPVFRLSLPDLRISPMRTQGDMPEWIGKHTATLEGGRISVAGGKVSFGKGRSERFWTNLEDFALDLETGQWEQITRRNWRQFFVRPEQRRPLFGLSRADAVSKLPPANVPHTTVLQEWNHLRLLVEGVAIAVVFEGHSVEVIVEGTLPSGTIDRLVDEIRSNAETVFQSRCTLEQPHEAELP